MQGTPVNIAVGSHVWVEDPEIAWIDAVVSKINGAEVEADASNGKKVTHHLFLYSSTCLKKNLPLISCIKRVLRL